MPWVKLLVTLKQKPLTPNFSILDRSEGTTLSLFSFISSPLIRNNTTHRAEQPWLITVAAAAHFTPIRNKKMKMGSSIIFTKAPIMTVAIPTTAWPWAVMKGLAPKEIRTKGVPKR